MKVLINGGGIAGLTFAYCLLRDGHEVVVAEKSSHPREGGYMIDFFGAGYDVADRLGILAELASIHYPIARLIFVNFKGIEKFSLPYSSLRKRVFANRHFNFMRGALERTLYEKVSEGVVRFGTTVRSFEQGPHSITVALSDQSRHEVDLLVGADGIHSTIRKLAFGQESSCTRFLGYHALAFIVNDPELARWIKNKLYTLTVPGKQVTVYPIGLGRIATLFLHKQDKAGSQFSAHEALTELRQTYAGMGWIIPRLLRQCSEQHSIYFDAVSQVILPKWSQGRVVLIGDAAHCVSLVAGQGASLAMAGAYVLHQELARQREIPVALARYEQKLRPLVESKQRTGRSLARWFVPDSEFRIELRDLFLRTSTWPIASQLTRRQIGAGGTALFTNR